VTTPIRTERLELRAPDPADLDGYAAMFADVEVLRLIGDGTAATRAETAEWLERTIRRNASEGWDRRSVVRVADGELLGWCGIARHEVEGSAEPELGYVLGRAHWGKGYATEAALTLLYAWEG